MFSAATLPSVLSGDGWKLKDVEKLLKRDRSSINERDSHGYTPLHVVLKNKNCSADIVKLLLKYGADVNRKSVWGVSPLMVALCDCKDYDVVMTLIEKGANVHVFNPLWQSILCMALRCGGSQSVIRLLLDAGCFLDECRDVDHHGSALFCATHAPRSVLNSEVLQMLIERGADINAVNSHGMNVMCFALGSGNEGSTIQLLLQSGGSLNGCQKHSSALICATARDYYPLKSSVVQVLLEAGVCPHQVNADGLTALQIALRRSKYDTRAIALLLDCHKGVDLNTLLDNQNNSLLHLAVENLKCKSSVVKLLVRQGVKVDGVNIKGDTPLNKAVRISGCQPSFIKILLKKDASVDFNKCVLLAVKVFQDVKIFKLLLAACAQISNTVFYWVLKIISVQLNYHPDRLVCFRFLVRVYFLQVSDYSMPFLKCDDEYYEDILNFRDQCVPELLKMKSKNVGRGHTLNDFLRYSSSYKHAENEEKMYDFDQLLEAIANDAFPLYFEIIADKVGKGPMKAKLQKVRISAPKYSSANVCVKEIVLPYDVMLKISHYLEKEDLLRLILASFSNAEDSISNV